MEVVTEDQHSGDDNQNVKQSLLWAKIFLAISVFFPIAVVILLPINFADQDKDAMTFVVKFSCIEFVVFSLAMIFAAFKK